jgi:hypothetical protein
MDVGELFCSDPTACASGEVCCLVAERDMGQNNFLVARAYCAPSSKCTDGNLQHHACRLGSCPGQSCLEYQQDTNGPQTLKVAMQGFGTCQ